MGAVTSLPHGQFQSDCVASFRRIVWPASVGFRLISTTDSDECLQLASFNRIPWPVSLGFHGQFQSDCVASIARILHSNSKYNGERLFRTTLLRYAKVWIFLEFLSGKYTFPFWFEIVLVPLLIILIVTIGTMKGSKSENPRKFIQFLINLLGGVITFYVVYTAARNLDTVFSMDSLRSLILEPFLSLTFIPMIYATLAYVKIDSLLRRMKYWIPVVEVRRYALRCLVLRIGFNVRRLWYFDKAYGMKLMRISSKEQADSFFQSIVFDEEG